MVRVPPDPAVVRRRLSWAFDKSDKLTRRNMRRLSKLAGGDEATAREWEEMVTMDADTRAMALEDGPEALDALGIDITQWPVYMFFGAVGLHYLTVWRSFGMARDILAEKRRREEEAQKKRDAARESVPATVTPAAGQSQT